MTWKQNRTAKDWWLVFGILLLLMPLAASCQPDALEPPRIATQTAISVSTPTSPASPHISLVPTPTYDPAAAGQGDLSSDVTGQSTNSLVVWVNESPGTRNRQFITATDAFVERTGIEVDLVMVAPDLLPDLVRTAAISDTLPDIIVHPFEYSAGWAADGIVDPAAASAGVDILGKETFDSAALEKLQLDESGTIAAIPSDGWQELILYRKDWFADAGLEPPTTYSTTLSAAAALFQPDSVVSGLIIPTDSSLLSTQQAFEFIAAANGCELVDAEGRITILHPACLEALEYYRSLVNEYSPIGVQTEISALNAYLTGRTGLIFASPAVLPAIAGFDDAFKPSCPLCARSEYLAENTGIVTKLTGFGELAQEVNFGSINALGITPGADREMASLFVDYWFNEGYEARLSDAPESRVPFRQGTSTEPSVYTDAWRNMAVGGSSSTLADLFGEESASLISDGIATSDRWGFAENQTPIISILHEGMVISPLLQEMLSGYFTSSQTVVELYLAIIDQLPSYPFPIEIATSEDA